MQTSRYTRSRMILQRMPYQNRISSARWTASIPKSGKLSSLHVRYGVSRLPGTVAASSISVALTMRRRWWWIWMSKEELEKKSLSALLRIAGAWYDQMKAGEIPSISLPTRTKYNIEFDDS